MLTDVVAQSVLLTVKVSVSAIVVVVVSMPAERAPLHLDVNTSRGSTSLPTGSVQPHRPASLPLELGGSFRVRSSSTRSALVSPPRRSTLTKNSSNCCLVKKQNRLFLPSTVTAVCSHGNIVAFLLNVE